MVEDLYRPAGVTRQKRTSGALLLLLSRALHKTISECKPVSNVKLSVIPQVRTGIGTGVNDNIADATLRCKRHDYLIKLEIETNVVEEKAGPPPYSSSDNAMSVECRNVTSSDHVRSFVQVRRVP